MKVSDRTDVQRAKEIIRINFGAQQINDLLGGGLETKAITEMFGEYRCSLSLSAALVCNHQLESALQCSEWRGC